MAWFRINDAILDDPRVQLLPRGQHMPRFRAALRGEESEFSKHIRRMRLSVTSNEWRALREVVFERDDYTCQYCGARGRRLECDHIFPASRGGSDDLSNLATACRPCNRDKGDLTIEEWRGTV